MTPLREGGSLPGLVEADDLGTYVVKFRGAGQGRRALVAEVIVTELARRLGVRVPELCALELDARIAKYEADDEVQDLLLASVGLNLGSGLPARCVRVRLLVVSGPPDGRGGAVARRLRRSWTWCRPSGSSPPRARRTSRRFERHTSTSSVHDSPRPGPGYPGRSRGDRRAGGGLPVRRPTLRASRRPGGVRQRRRRPVLPGTGLPWLRQPPRRAPPPGVESRPGRYRSSSRALGSRGGLSWGRRGGAGRCRASRHPVRLPERPSQHGYPNLGPSTVA